MVTNPSTVAHGAYTAEKNTHSTYKKIKYNKNTTNRITP